MVFLLALFPALASHAQLVQLQQVDVTASVTHPSFPFSATHNRSVGGVSNQTVYLFTSAPTQVTLSFDLAHTRSGLGLSESYGTLYFATTQPLFYTLQGDWTLSGTASYFNQQALLETTDRATTAFDGKNTFSGFFQPEASNLDYDLGVLEGDPFFSHLSGSLSGVLPAGDYVFEYSYDFENISAPTSLAQGSLSLTLALIPEPETHLLLVLGIITLFGMSWRKSRPACFKSFMIRLRAPGSALRAK